MFSGYNNGGDDDGMDIDSFGSPYGRPAAQPGVFTETYRCQPASALPVGNPLRETLDYCGKVILPQSALEQLSMHNIEYPMVFKLVNEATGQFSHCGVLEFSAREGVAYVPGWLMETLTLNAGDFITISNTKLPRGTLIRIQPQSPAFLDITDPRAVLEFTLRQFTTLSPNDCFWMNYADDVYKVRVLETEPAHNGGILVIETDLNVDFAPPVGYQEPTPTSKPSFYQGKSIAGSIVVSGTSPTASSQPALFSGQPRSLRSSEMVSIAPSASVSSSSLSVSATRSTSAASAGPVAIKVPRNTVYFGSAPAKPKEPTASPGSAASKPQPFQGTSGSLR